MVVQHHAYDGTLGVVSVGFFEQSDELDATVATVLALLDAVASDEVSETGAEFKTSMDGVEKELTELVVDLRMGRLRGFGPAMT